MAENNNGAGEGAGAPAGAEPTFEDIIHFDPFEESGSGEVESAPEQPVEAPPPPEAPTPPPTQQQPDLRQLVQEQTHQLTAALRQPPPQPQQQQGPPLKFNLGVPPALTAALRSEDPQQFEAGVGALINGVANHVWNTVMDHLQNQVIPSVPRMIDQHVNSIQRQQSVAQDFYGKYPQLGNPGLRPMVQTIGAQIAEEFARAGHSLEWGDQIRDAIAERIFQMIPALRQAQQVAQQPAPSPQRRFSTGNGTRPPRGGDSTLQSEMEAVIFGPRNG